MNNTSSKTKHEIQLEQSLELAINEVPKNTFTAGVLLSPQKTMLESLTTQGAITSFVLDNLHLISGQRKYSTKDAALPNEHWFVSFVECISKNPETPQPILEAMATIKNTDYISLEKKPAATYATLCNRLDQLIKDSEIESHFFENEFAEEISRHPNICPKEGDNTLLDFVFALRSAKEIKMILNNPNLNFSHALSLVCHLAKNKDIELSEFSQHTAREIRINSFFQDLAMNSAWTDEQFTTLILTYIDISHLFAKRNRDKEFIVSAAVKNTSFSHKAALELLSQDLYPSLKGDEYNDLALTICKAMEERLLPWVVDAKEFPNYITEDYINLNPLLKKKNSISDLYMAGYDPASLIYQQSLKKTMKSLIGSAHKEECALISRSQFLSIDGFSSLQGFFYDESKGKLDRHSYIQFISELNESEIDLSSFSLTSQALKTAFDVVGRDGVLNVVKSQSNKPLSARDTLNFLYSVTVSPDPDETERQIKLVKRWLNKNERYDEIFHDYLSNKERRDNGLVDKNVTFYQARFAHNIDAVQALLPKDKDINWTFFLPKDSISLRALGRSQRHCVGSDHYADSCASGHSIIFAIHPKKGMKHGYTFQFSRAGGLLQTEGFATSKTPEHLIEVANACFEVLVTDEPVTRAA